MVIRRAAGFTYLTILLIVALMGAGLALAGEVWHTGTLREREAELLHAGSEYRKAIERYYLSGPRQYPRTLADLLKDPRQPGTVRHLRRIYADPITGAEEWGLVRAPDGGIAGVHSLSNAQPIKSHGFRIVDRDFEGKTKYAEWRFVYAPQTAVGTKPAPQIRTTVAPGDRIK